MQLALTTTDQQRLESLADRILAHYDTKRPPVPVETILQHPPEGMLEAVDITDLSLVFGMGEHRYEYRMALARLLYRELCRKQNLLGENPRSYNEASRYFAAVLLIPQKWILRATRWPLVTLQQLSEDFRVPEYVMSTRLSNLGKHVRGMD